jgi:HipA-like protein
MNNKLTVFINDEKIGIVEFGMQSPVFSYTTSNNKKILSLSMKDMTKKYGRIFKYFIENLRLEDKDKQKCISLKSKISFDDYYNYFKKFGLDCAGAIKFIDESDNEDTLNTISNTIREIDDSNIEKKILDDINNVNVENELQHCSLAGYQPKILLLKKENK